MGVWQTARIGLAVLSVFVPFLKLRLVLKLSNVHSANKSPQFENRKHKIRRKLAGKTISNCAGMDKFVEVEMPSAFRVWIHCAKDGGRPRGVYGIRTVWYTPVHDGAGQDR